MINMNDVNEISAWAADAVRVKTSQFRVTVSGNDQDRIRNFITGVLSNYADDSNIIDTQYNPATNRVEKIGESKEEAAQTEA